MELMFAGIAGILIGLVGYLAARDRAFIGSALIPAVGGIVALALWAGATWLGTLDGFAWLAYDQGWIWWITMGVTVIVVGILALTVGRARSASDEELFDRLRHVGRASV